MKDRHQKELEEQKYEEERRAHVEAEREHVKKSTEMTRMGEAPIGKLLASMSWPAILSMTILALYNMVDSIFVSRVSEGALTAVSLVMPIQLLMVALFVGSSVGVNSLIARRLGARRYAEADQAASTSIRIGVFNYLIFLVVGLVATKPFIGLYTTDPTIYKYGVQYMMIVTVGSLFTAVDVQIEKVLQSTGNMIAPMVISMSGALTNLVMDPLLIFGIGPFPRLEVAGAALATILGQLVALIMAFLIFFRKKRDVRLKIRGFRFDWKIVKDIYAVGLPSIVMQAIGSVMLIGYNRILAVSATAVAVLGVYFKLQSFFFMPVFGLNQGAIPIMGYNYGARNRKRLMHTYRLGIIVAMIIMIAGFLVFQLMPDKLLAFFDADENMLAMGIPALRRISICFIPAAFGIMTATLFQATGHGIYSMFASIIRQLAAILPLAYVLFHYVGITASWFAFPLAEIVGTIYAIITVIHLYRKELRHL